MSVETWMLVVAVIVLLWLYTKWQHSYWSSKGIVSPAGLPFFGHANSFISGKRWIALNKYYEKLKNNNKYWGLYEFFTPILMIRDPDLLKHILVKDFEHFVDRRIFGDQEGSYMTDMLTNKTGSEWKELRALMTPTFSSGKMRSMFHLIREKADKLVSFSFKQAGDKNLPVNMKEIFGRFTMDTIASCAFGIECNSFSDSKPVFTQKAEAFFSFRGIRAFKMTLMIIFPKLYDFLGFKVDNEEMEFFAKICKENFSLREKGVKRGDFLDLLMEARAAENARPGKKVLAEHTLIAQSVLFLVAGYDTTASTLAFSAFSIAKHPQYQQRLRQELQQLVKEYGSITYEGIMEAKFLDAVLMETLRLYPPGTVGERKCTKEYRIPGTDITLKPGDMIEFPIWSIHHDPDFWPDAEEYKPERFLPENKGNIQSFTHMPFGMGPRNCIAMRFALMEAKVALAQLVLAAHLKLAPGHENLEFEDSPFLLRPKHGIMLQLTPVKEE